MCKGVVYSLDAYIAAVIAILSIALLISYSGISEDYFSYYQVKMLSIDGLKTLEEAGYLYNGDESAMEGALDKLIPPQYAYALYRGNSLIAHRGDVNKFGKAQASTSLVVPFRASCPNPYRYITCKGTTSICSVEELASHSAFSASCIEDYEPIVFRLVVAI